ncbi:hypothetical protein BGZ80_008003 [Entomortierella chlamydospora]|uniref:Oxidoreductase AflY n=1 Tax=Entomortierella chlamydospora TaxID=101097 RepID=A0A9P6MZ35_9FUNG|nr:hypothetical protein BGZ79_008150 [Entomortierella chlamydospora]KAG0017710.1 hypothetical protein BGZ80_008003 [Entomortierella chlamydospora]
MTARTVAKNFFAPQIPSKSISLALPGITQLARDSVTELLEKNHNNHHCFFNERGFHNHLVHGVLAGYSLGASPERLRAIYESHAVEQRSIGSIQKSFTPADWKHEIGKQEFYASYLDFFSREVPKLGRVEAIVKYAFDTDVIGRTFSGAFHPLIHLGYGVDFGIDAIVAEGLAMMAVTSTMMAPFVVAPATTVDKVTAKIVYQLSISESSSPSTVASILSALQEDRELDNVTSYPESNKTIDVSKSKVAATKIQKLLSGWKIEETSQDIDLKAKELYKACVLAVGGTGLRNEKVKQDFFLMHALTSVLFVHKLVHALPPAYAVSCLKSHLGAALAYYISRGRPHIDVDALLNYHGKQPLDPTNPWLSIFKRAVDIDEVHVTKVVRSCALGDLLFGVEESYSRLLLNTAQISLDLKGDWEFEGVGWPQTWE